MNHLPVALLIALSACASARPAESPDAKASARSPEETAPACKPGDVVGCRAQCDAHDMASCTDLGRMYAGGKHVAKDEVQAATLYQQACEAGYQRACSNLGSLYERGGGVSKDEARAVGLYKGACDVGYAGGCANLGLAYDRGKGVPEGRGACCIALQAVVRRG